MIHSILFSFDRASQLSCLLESIEKFDTGKILEIQVLYGYSSDQYRKGYEILQKKYPEIGWLEEKNAPKPPLNFNFNPFSIRNLYWWRKHPVLKRNKSNFKKLLITSIENSQTPYLLFLTDDSQFTKNIEVTASVLSSFISDPLMNSFSLRHGQEQPNGQFHTEEGNHIRWNVYENDPLTDWGHPFSVDGHIYSKQVLLPVIKKIIFNNPNTFELFTALYVKKKCLFSTIFACDESCLVGFELNRVQQFFSNQHLGISTTLLNDYFLEGYALEISYNKSKKACFRPEIEKITVKKNEDIILLYEK